MYVLGLTGSIAMGKSTIAQMFRDISIPVHDADASVHALYSGKAVPLIEELFPGTTRDGVVDRQKLGEIVLNDSESMRLLENTIHPLVREIEQEFITQARSNHVPFVILDIPLLFETGAQNRLDGVIVVTADPAEQKRRVLSRPNMTPAKFNAILARQTPDAEKRRKADFLIDTHTVKNAPDGDVSEINMGAARMQVGNIANQIISGSWKPEKTYANGD